MKLFLKIFLLLSILFSFYWVHADWEDDTKVIITTTEKLPWMDCGEPTITSKWTTAEVKVYECEVKKWFWSIMTMISWMIKYFTYIAMISAVLFIVVNGIMYSMSWVDSGMKDEAKKRITKTLIWIILLLLSWYILSLFFPWIYG